MDAVMYGWIGKYMHGYMNGCMDVWVDELHHFLPELSEKYSVLGFYKCMTFK